jgi:hypothetical protein
VPVLLAVCAVVLAGQGRAWGWGRMEHRASADLAWGRLTPAARAAVHELLDPGESLADASTWADEVRRTWPGSARWHYVNVPISEPAYSRRFAPREGGVVEKVEQFTRVVADRSAPRERRRVALRLLVHLVQDLHQPLHVGDRGDRGGNNLQVQFFARGSNLHRVWDTGLIGRAYHDERSLARALDALADGPLSARWAAGTPEEWASESLQAAHLAYLRPEDGSALRPGAKLGQAYLETNLPIARLRCAQSGVRLAALLNAALDTTP